MPKNPVRHDDVAQNSLSPGSRAGKEVSDGRPTLDLGESVLDNDLDACGYDSAAGAEGGATEVVFAFLLFA